MQIRIIWQRIWGKRRLLRAAAWVCVGPMLFTSVYAQSTPKMQLPADRREYEAAAQISDPAQRLAAFRAFIQHNPKSLRVYSAQSAILQTLVRFYPEQTDSIDQIAKAMIDNATSQQKPYLKEYYVAGLLAETEPDGVDLPLAESYAKDAVKQLTEPNFIAQAKANQEKYKLPPQSAEAMHRTFVKSRANALASLANVYLDEGRLEEASAALEEGYGLSGQVGKVSLLMARIALLRHDEATALEDLERADLQGGLKDPWLGQMKALYAKVHGGSDAGITESLDRKYSELFPSPFVAAPREPGNGSHVALLELFTGSGCPPCVAADLAQDALLESYSRKEVVILEQDLHIPEPDPLANPETVARADAAEIVSTPSFVLDGRRLPSLGGTREESQTLYDKLTKFLDNELEIPSPVKLTVEAQQSADGLVSAKAVVTVGGIEDVRAMLAAESKLMPSAAAQRTAAPVAKPAPAAEAQPDAEMEVPAEPSLLVHFALVEDHVRYSGENGIRFHRMVVRSIMSPAGKTQVVSPGTSTTLHASFDPSAISAKWSTYLSAYELNNERYGRIKFLSKDTSMNPSHLAVAVWVQDASTRRVLQAAFVPLAGEQ
jgi:hypothetical protein